MANGYEVETVDAFQHHTWTMTEDIYVQHVMELPRDTVSERYASLYQDSVYWENADENGDPREYIKGDRQLTDEGVTAFAEQDFYDGPDAWAFTVDDFGYESA